MQKPLFTKLSTLYMFLGYCTLHIPRLLAKEGHWEGSNPAVDTRQPNRISEGIYGKRSGEFLRDIFRKYGEGDVITLAGFELLLRNLGIGGLDFENKPDLSDARVPNTSASSSFVKEESNSSFGQANHSENHQGDASRRQHSRLIENSFMHSDQRKCLSTLEILALTNQNPLQQEISPQRFLDLCPVIIHEVDQRHCDHSTNIRPRDEKMTEIKPRTEAPSKYVWFYSILAVLVISVTGMLSVAIVPIIRKYFYQKLLQFLVALAIGSLIGDALLHLLPHAMKSFEEHHNDPHSHGHDHADHSEHGHSHREVWLGLTALAGICLFFCTEQLLNFLHVCKGRKELKKKDRMPKIPLNYMVGEKLSKYSYSSYGCHQEEETLQDLSTTDPCGDEDHHTCFQKPPAVDVIIEQDESALMASKCLNSTNDIIVAPGITFGNEKQQNGASKVKTSSTCLNKDTSESSIILPSMHPGHHHGHSHKHMHDIPRTASATAWMVIAGDGLHNFSDGMAIGAAFASSLTGGLSTSIAVFCHELPHELGDFALLLKAGMGTRQALLYNGLSSVLCFFGMLVGLAIGNIHSANSWVFAAAAGMFIYIALVDMMPELNCETWDSPLTKFVIQFLGISIGATIMCLIALYEHDLQNIIEDGS